MTKAPSLRPKGLPRTAYGLIPSDKHKLLLNAWNVVDTVSGLSAISLVRAPFYNREFHHPDFTEERVAYVEHDRLVMFSPPPVLTPEQRADKKAPLRNPKDKTTGYFTKSAAKRMRKCLTPWVLAVQTSKELNFGNNTGIKAYLTFATLTLPATQFHSDQELKRALLMPFIQYMIRSKMTELYLWRAEPQKNGNLHFHLFFDRYIDKTLLQETWNTHLDRLGYIDKFSEKHGHRNPPTTDIRKCPDSMHLVSYVMKYAGKKPMYLPSFQFVNGIRIKKSTPYHPLNKAFTDSKGKFHPAETSENLCIMRPLDGRLWGCSDSLRSLSMPLSGESMALNLAVEEMASMPQFRVVKRPRCTMIFGPVDLYMQQYNPGLWLWWLSFHQHQFNRLYGTQYHVNDYDIGNPDIPPTFDKSSTKIFFDADIEHIENSNFVPVGSAYLPVECPF